MSRFPAGAVALLAGVAFSAPASAQVAVRGETVYTMAGPLLRDGVVLVKDGKISAVGPADSVRVPAGYRTLRAKVVTPGLVDGRSTVGLSGFLNQPQDQDQLETSAAVQPELRAVDAYNPTDRLVGWVRGFGVTTLHTGHGPGALVSGQTMVVKTRGRDVETDTVVPFAMVAATLGDGARAKEEGKSPGTRAKAIAVLRGELVKAQEYARKMDAASQNAAGDESKSGGDRAAGKDKEDGKDKAKAPERNLKLEALARVLKGEVPLLVTVHRAHDIMTVLRLRDEFGFKLVLDGAAEAYMVKEQIKKAGVGVLIHPTMARSVDETENLSMETLSVLRKAGIPAALESGFESYVPKTRVVLFEAALAAANGLSFDQALAAVTIDAARLLGVDNRVGSLEAGKDGDLALYDGDPFEYTSHCVFTVIEGEVVSEGAN
jgi:imidazolonepropionase-like amidohydrolase